jgi:hypothetical protein
MKQSAFQPAEHSGWRVVDRESAAPAKEFANKNTMPLSTRTGFPYNKV